MNRRRAGRRWAQVLGSTLVLALGTVVAQPQAGGDGVAFTEREIRTLLRMSPLDAGKMRDPTNAYDGNEAAQRFGETLFFDTRMSASGEQSCAGCHDPLRGWAGGDAAERLGRPAGRHTPGLWNVAYHRWYNWDGSADSLWAQSLGPMENERELANTRVGIARTIQQELDLRAAYEALFGPIPEVIAPRRLPASGRPVAGDPEHPDHRSWLSLTAAQRAQVDWLVVNLGKAIAAFEATIVSSDAPFDRFVEGLRTGDPARLAAITPRAKRGLKLFLDKGRCVSCHSGPNFSDGEFHNAFLGNDSDPDLGRWNGIDRLRESPFNALSAFNDAATGESMNWVSYVVRSSETKRRFKTPTLRNLVSSAPYMHTGQLATLEDVLNHYDGIGEAMDEEERHVELVLESLRLSAEEKRDLIAFLHSLTDEGLIHRLGIIAKR
jgi:cytochrome c peroxidase